MTRIAAAILDSIRTNIPNFNPTTAISDWQPAPRNAFKEIYPMTKLSGSWFHFISRIWAKTQKLGLTQGFRENYEITNDILDILIIWPKIPCPYIQYLL